MGLAICSCSTLKKTPVRTTTKPKVRITNALKMVSFTRFYASLKISEKMLVRFSFSNISIFLILFYLPALVFAQQKRYEFQRGLMGSPFRLVFYTISDSLANSAAGQVFGRIEKLNEILSDYRDGSEINRLSAQSGSGKWIAVSDDLFEVIRISRKLGKKTAGAFDITIGPVVQLWRRAMRRNRFPEEKEIAKARQAVGYRNIRLRPGKHTVRLTHPHMRLDVGGIGKGYAADEAVALFKKLGITSVLVDAGGDLTLAESPPGKEGWEVEVTSGTQSDSTIRLLLSNVGIATSGATYRYLEHNGVRYSHIVNPATGVGLRHHVRTTVIAPNGTLADALATAFSVEGIDGAMKIERRFPQIKVWLLETKQGEVKSWNTLK